MVGRGVLAGSFGKEAVELVGVVIDCRWNRRRVCAFSAGMISFGQSLLDVFLLAELPAFFVDVNALF
jgi:hypothetical protein